MTTDLHTEFTPLDGGQVYVLSTGTGQKIGTLTYYTDDEATKDRIRLWEHAAELLETAKYILARPTDPAVQQFLDAILTAAQAPSAVPEPCWHWQALRGAMVMVFCRVCGVHIGAGERDDPICNACCPYCTWKREEKAQVMA